MRVLTEVIGAGVQGMRQLEAVCCVRTIREALIEFAVNRAKTANLDEVGAMVPERNWLLRQALLVGGFRSLGEFRWLTTELPLPGWAARPLSSRPAGEKSQRRSRFNHSIASTVDRRNRHGCVCAQPRSLLCKRLPSNGRWHRITGHDPD